MTATIKAVEITEVADLDPAKFKPDDPENFSCTFGLTIGPTDGEGGEQFYITVCTPERLADECRENGFVWGRHRLIVPYFDLEKIYAIITKFVNNCSGTSWHEIATKLARLGAWEFEDYAGPMRP